MENVSNTANSTELQSTNTTEPTVNTNIKTETNKNYEISEAELQNFMSIAVKEGYRDVVGDILKKGININQKDSNGITVLMKASECGRTAIVEVLLKEGAKIDEKDNEGRTALMWAALIGNEDIVDMLIAKGANQADLQSITTNKEKMIGELMCAAECGHLETVEYLIENNVDMDAKNDDGSTALIYAAANGQSEIVDILIRTGASLDEEDAYGRTALAWAKHFKFENIIKDLIHAGAK